MAIGPVVPNPLSLESQFRDFYEQVVLLKARAGNSPPQSADSDAMETDRDAELAPKVVQERLVSLLTEQSRDAARTPGIRTEDLDEAQYVAAATADEAFVNLDWPGREYWTHNLIESRLFGSHVAGERLFRRLDKLLHDRNRAQQDLATVYLLVLGVGFRGKYRGEDDGGQISRCQRELLWFVRQDEPRRPSQSEGLLFPQVQDHVYLEGTGRRLRGLRYWKIAALAAPVLWLGVSYVLWGRLADPIEEGASRVKLAVETMPADDSGY